MPEFMQKTDHLGVATGSTDWNKFFMGAAVAVVFVMQTWSQMQHEESRSAIRDLDKIMVPRPELTDKLQFSEGNRKKVFRDIDRRLDELELKQQKLLDNLAGGVDK